MFPEVLQCARGHCITEGSSLGRSVSGGVSFGRWWFLCRCFKEALEATALDKRGSKIRGWISEGAVLIEAVSARVLSKRPSRLQHRTQEGLI